MSKDVTAIRNHISLQIMIFYEIKTKLKNRFEVANDFRCALSQVEPQYEEVAGKHQCQNSH